MTYISHLGVYKTRQIRKVKTVSTISPRMKELFYLTIKTKLSTKVYLQSILLSWMRHGPQILISIHSSIFLVNKVFHHYPPILEFPDPATLDENPLSVFMHGISHVPIGTSLNMKLTIFSTQNTIKNNSFISMISIILLTKL